jgi:beta-galactosidase
MMDFKPVGFISEIGAGGVVTTHCDYNQADWKVNKYEPEEYQQLVSEHNFQQSFRGDDSHLGLFCVWCLRELSDGKYKGPVGINTKGLLTYAGDKKDIYYLYRSFLRPDVPTIWIASKRYFLRRGAVDNGIKVYSNARQVTLMLNGRNVSTLDNGSYVIPAGPWTLHTRNKKKSSSPGPSATPMPTGTPIPYVPEKVALRTGKNLVTATDDQGHSDTATIYFYGANGSPELPASGLPISGLASSNPDNPAYYMDMPVQAQWPFYYDLDSTADNSWNTIPADLEGATWIALRRVTKPGEATDLSFTMTRAAKIYVMASKMNTTPAFADSGQFKQVSPENVLWRDNAMLLVPAQLYVHEAAAGEKIDIPLGDRDAVVLFK